MQVELKILRRFMNTNNCFERIRRGCKRFLILNISILLLYSCENSRLKYKEESETSSRILESLLKKDTSAIFNRIGNNLILKDSEGIIFKMALASMLLEKYGIPQKGRFTFKAYPERGYKNVDILVPFTNSNIDDIKTPVISFEFVKYLGSNKIENFSVKIGVLDEKFEVPSNKFSK
jgi:hypothetical protein